MAPEPRNDAIFSWDHRGTRHQPRHQPRNNRHFQRPAALEAVPQPQPATLIHLRVQGAVRAGRFPPHKS